MQISLFWVPVSTKIDTVVIGGARVLLAALQTVHALSSSVGNHFTESKVPGAVEVHRPLETVLCSCYRHLVQRLSRDGDIVTGHEQLVVVEHPGAGHAT